MMAAISVMSVSEYMQTSSSILAQVPSDLLRDAQFLLADILQTSASMMLVAADMELTPEQAKRFDAGLAQLKQGKPLAYVVGNQPFWSLNFSVNEHTLIPRPDTEHVVENALALGDELVQQLNEPLHVLDLGTGSGVIGICIKHERPNWQVTATDFSQDALAMAKQNADCNHTDVQFLQGSWFAAVQADSMFHIIVSNPPYIAPDDEHLADLTHEPLSALVAENAGMADIETIVSTAPQYLSEHGWLLIEHGYNQGKQARDCFLANGFKQVATITDYGGNDRLTKGQL